MFEAFAIIKTSESVVCLISAPASRVGTAIGQCNTWQSCISGISEHVYIYVREYVYVQNIAFDKQL